MNTALQVVNKPGAVGAAVNSRFCGWRGASGSRYIVSVFSVDARAPDRGLPDFDGVVVLAVRRQEDRRECVAVWIVEDHFDVRAVRAAGLAADAQEWHIHFLAEDEAARGATADDLRRQSA